MSDLTDRLRRYKRDRSGYAEYCHQAADEIDRLLILRDDYKSDSIKLQRERDALREQLTLAESVRAAQVAGLTEGMERLRERVAVLEVALRVAFKWGGGLTVAEGEQIRAALKGEA